MIRKTLSLHARRQCEWWGPDAFGDFHIGQHDDALHASYAPFDGPRGVWVGDDQCRKINFAGYYDLTPDEAQSAIASIYALMEGV
jgi:hypothetical protein